MTQLAYGDWVTLPDFPCIVGVVQRVAKDGSWAVVKWPAGTKRMPTAKLLVQHTIRLADGWTVTDVTRQRELEG